MKKNNLIYIILFMVGYFIAELCFSGALALIFKVLKIDYHVNSGMLAVAILAMRLFWVMAYIYIYEKVIKVNLNDFLNKSFKKNIKLFGMGITVGILAILFAILLRYESGFVSEIYLLDWLKNINKVVIYFISTFLTVVVEEILLRKSVYITLRKSNNTFIYSSCITSSVFALIHIQRGIGLIDLLFYFIFSMLLCYAVEYYKSIWICIGFHCGWNFISDGGAIFKIEYLNNLSYKMIFFKGISILVIFTIICLLSVYKYRSKNKGVLANEL